MCAQIKMLNTCMKFSCTCNSLTYSQDFIEQFPCQKSGLLGQKACQCLLSVLVYYCLAIILVLIQMSYMYLMKLDNQDFPKVN